MARLLSIMLWKKNPVMFCTIRNKGYLRNKKVQTIKRVNYENKVLYGAVIKAKKSKTKIVIDESIEEGIMSSEIYWISQKLQEPEPKPIIKVIPIPPENAHPRLVKLQELVNLPESLEKFQKSLLPIPIKEKRKLSIIGNETFSEIPFDEQTFNALINFPLDMRNLRDKSQSLDALEISSLPSVGRILQATMSDASRKALIKWKQLKIAELGFEGFQNLQKSHLQHGSEFHSSIEKYFKSGVKPNKNSMIYETWKSVDPVLKLIGKRAEVVEKSVYHPVLKYKGIVDCVATIDSELHVIEWKKSDLPKKSIIDTYDAPLQLCAYLGAIYANPNYNLDIKKGGVVIAYTNGKPADFHQLDSLILRKYWKIWLQRLKEYWIRYRDNTIPEPI